MHSSDEETARQTESFTKDSTTVLQLLGEEKTSDFRPIQEGFTWYIFIHKQEQVCMFMTT